MSLIIVQSSQYDCVPSEAHGHTGRVHCVGRRLPEGILCCAVLEWGLIHLRGGLPKQQTIMHNQRGAS